MTPIFQIIVGSFLLSILHASVPNHWLPLVIISKTERWNRTETLGVSAIAGLAHVASTLIIGMLVGWLGYQFSSRRALITGIIAPAILVALGLFYLVADWRGRRHHHHDPEAVPRGSPTSKSAVITSLVVAMFFSPCLEIEAYYFTAGALGWLGIATVSIIYMLVTVLGMLILVDLGRRGVQKIRLHFLQYHEKSITGVVLIVLGVLAYLFFE